MKLIHSEQEFFIIVLLGFIIGISLTAVYSYLFFHVIAELFSIIIAGVIFILTWNSRDKFDNGFFPYIGVAFFFIGSIDLIHTLAYKGMNIFTGYDTNLATQLWIAARYLEAISFFIALFMINRRVRVGVVFTVYSGVTALLLILIFSRHFPDCFIEGSGLTPFKIISEYIICLILLAVMFVLSQQKAYFSRDVLLLLYGALIATVLSELVFTSYVSVYGPANFLGHIFKIIAFALIYEAIVVIGIRAPFDMIFRRLSMSEQKYRELFENMDEGVAVFELVFDDDTTHDYRFLDVNSRYALMMGRDSSDVVGKTGFEIYGTSPPPHFERYHQIVLSGTPERFIACYQPEMKYYAVSAFRVSEKQVATVVADITALKISEGALIRANKKLQLLSQVTRHDINNDLSLAYASVDLLKGTIPDNPDTDQYFEYLRDSIDAINSKISFTRNYEQMGTEKPFFHLLAPLVEEVHASNHRFESISLTNSLGSLTVFADMMLPKVFANLMDNSDRHGKTVTMISLSYQFTRTGCDIIYEDNGVGISQEQKNLMFKPGYGTTHGFGLFLIREILLLTGIEITEEGEEGKGARFVMHVPKGGYEVS